jgi:hypothetical protein
VHLWCGIAFFVGVCVIEDIKEYLIERRLQPENIAFICGYLSDKPERWHEMFLLRCSGKTQDEIRIELNMSIGRVSQILNEIGGAISVISENYKS